MPTRPRVFPRKKIQMLIREVHKVQGTSGEWGFLAGVLVLVLGLLVNASCAMTETVNRDDKYRVDEPYGALRGPGGAALATVKINTECGSGTGVLVDPVHVLTAHHVINCADWPKTKFAEKLTVTTPDGVRHHGVTYDKLDGKMDVARLTMPDAHVDIVPVRIEHAKLGDTACMFTAVPEYAIKCAKVVLLRDSKQTRDVGVEYTDIWFGNSGSGVYNQNGALIGVASALLFCNQTDRWLFELTGERPDHVCGGFVTSIPREMQ